jgi:GalNAc-alpha-(1->4)-GalNAc-alpha-(1->3)-diNAcBac-PP-undecaprenol alpha-1,4-N-acetyl-D-galactosaminyltransferase
MEMYRILFLVSSMHGGGAERVAALLCNHWVSQGHSVTLMPTFSGRGECVYPLDKRVTLDFLADRVNSRGRGFFNKVRRLVELRRAIREQSPDVILSFMPHVNIAAVLAAWGLQVPVVVSERTFPPAMPLGKALENLRRWAYARASAVVVQTEQAREWLALNCPRAQGYVIPNPAVFPLPLGEPKILPSSVVEAGRKLVLAVGRLSEEKQFDSLIEAFKPLAKSDPDWNLVILGEGIEREHLEMLRDQLELADRVQLPGRVGNLGDWYERAEIFVMSSRFEGFPNTLVEAMAHGLPAVSFDCLAGPRDIIREAENGLLVQPDEGSLGLTNALRILMREDHQRMLMAARAVVVRDLFDIRHIANKWGRVLGFTGANDVQD